MLMKKPFIPFLALLLIPFTLTMCNKPAIPFELSEAERLMQSHPDSALRVLESISNPKTMQKAHYAEYGLLLTEARDKTYYPFTSDSVIRVAADYYENTENNQKLSKVYYYLGRVYQKLKKTPYALEYYLKAERLAEKVPDDTKPKSCIYNSIGDIYAQLHLYDDAMDAYKEAEYCLYACGDSIGIPFVLRNMARIYHVIEKQDREKKMYETVHQIVSLNTETVESLQSVYKINQKKISFIPNEIQDSYIQLSKKTINQLRAKRLIAPKEKIILFSGRVLHVKGIYRILNSLKKVVRVYPNFRLVIAGTVSSSKMVMECANSIAPKVVFLGQISKDEMNEWYQIADIGTLASYYEQCSYTGIEMMMHGLPIVASDGFCMNDMFVNNKNAKIAHIGDRNTPESFENDLSEIFIELLRSNKECKRLGKNGRKIYESHYQIKYMKEKYQTFFENIS